MLLATAEDASPTQETERALDGTEALPSPERSGEAAEKALPILEEWASTPVDVTALWLGYLLEGRLATDQEPLETCVERMVEAATTAFVKRQRRKPAQTGVGPTPTRGAGGRVTDAGVGAIPQPAAQAVGTGATNPCVGKPLAAVPVRRQPTDRPAAPHPTCPPAARKLRTGPPPSVAVTPPVSAPTRTWGVLTGNPFAALADIPEEGTPIPCNASAAPESGLSGARVRAVKACPRGSAQSGRGSRPEKRPWTLGDFMPAGGAVRKKKPTENDVGLRPLSLGGEDGPVSDRIRGWSHRGLGTAVTGPMQWRKGRKRDRASEGLRGRDSNHIPIDSRSVRERKEWPGWSRRLQGKTVATGVATDHWQGAVSRAHRDACRPRTDEPAPAPVRILKRPALDSAVKLPPPQVERSDP